MSGLEADNAVRAIIITGSGEKSFVLGVNIKEFADYGTADATAMSQNGQINVFDKIENIKKLVIAAINGFALEGGLELTLACRK